MEPKKRILLVDDEPAFTRLMKLNLEASGSFDVHVENTGARAVATARAVSPDLIFLDVIMPDVDGGQIAADLKADPKLAKTPIVFLTAAVSKNEMFERGDVIGGQLFLAKPVTMADVMEAIDRLVA